MKTIYIIITICLVSYLPAQVIDINKIDTSNYYDYNAFNGREKYLKGEKISETFLKKHEVLLKTKQS